jgi:hypothetical protein
MKKNKLIMFVAAMTLVTGASFNVLNAEGTEPGTDNNPTHSMKRWANPVEKPKAAVTNKEEQSVAWYVANMKEAREQNQECFDNPSIQSSPNCIHSLHALNISFAGGGNGRR